MASLFCSWCWLGSWVFCHDFYSFEGPGRNPYRKLSSGSSWERHVVFALMRPQTRCLKCELRPECDPHRQAWTRIIDNLPSVRDADDQWQCGHSESRTMKVSGGIRWSDVYFYSMFVFLLERYAGQTNLNVVIIVVDTNSRGRGL